MILLNRKGQRSVNALATFIQKQIDGSMIVFNSPGEIAARIDRRKANVIGYFKTPSGPEYENFKKVASLLREDCTFWMGSGEIFNNETAKSNRVYFYRAKSDEVMEFDGGLANYGYLKTWLTEKCIPLVREITFENAEELTEEGLPFLILFRLPDDVESEKVFTEQVVKEIADQKNSINCLLADGKKFAHPLRHLNKTEHDLPLIAIDSFRHMYLFPDMNELTVPGKLRQFVLDLHSGKLHREFHHRPSQVKQELEPKIVEAPSETQPPPSVFKQLKPSGNRYSLVHKDEL
uniref:Thioredoxin domain-containing protein n=1 Tax=Syphacia muris TaxID=451379 RepID=A0A0N5B124_9BILA